MPCGLCDSQVDCCVVQVEGFAFPYVGGGVPTSASPNNLRRCSRSWLASG